MRSFTFTANNGKKHLDTNAFVRKEDLYIADYAKFFAKFTAKEFLCSNMSEYFDSPLQFMNEVIAYETTHSTAKAGHNKVGVTMTFLLDGYHEEAQLKRLAYKIDKKCFENLPFYCYLKKIGDGYFLHFYVCERAYLHNPATLEKRQKYDKYIDSVTGKMCKKEDKNAVLAAKKGKLIGREKTHFTQKSTLFKYANTKHFVYCMNRLKSKLMAYIEQITGAEIEKGISMRKYNLNEFGPKVIQNVRAYNDLIRSMEMELTKDFNILIQCGISENEAYETLLPVKAKFTRVFHETGKLTLGKKARIKIGFYKYYKYAKRDIYEIGVRFEKDLTAAMDKKVGLDRSYV